MDLRSTPKVPLQNHIVWKIFSQPKRFRLGWGLEGGLLVPKPTVFVYLWEWKISIPALRSCGAAAAWLCICVFVYLCICVYIYLCICVFVYLCIWVFVFVYMYLCICICVFVFVRVKNLNSCREIKVSRGCSSQNLLSTNCQSSSSLITKALTHSNRGSLWNGFGKL